MVAGCSTSTLPGAGQSGAEPAWPKSIVVVVSGIVVVVVVVVGTTVVVDVSVATGPTVTSASGGPPDAEGLVINAKVTANAIPPLKSAVLMGT